MNNHSVLEDLRIRKRLLNSNMIRVSELKGNCFVSLSSSFLVEQGYEEHWFSQGELMLTADDFKALMKVYFEKRD